MEVLLSKHTYGLSLFLLMLLLMTPCMSQTFDREVPAPGSAVQQTDNTIKKIESDPFFQQFRADLEQRNVELTSPDISRIAWLSAAPGIGYSVGRYWMNIHLYPDAASAQENADEIPANAAAVTASWVAPPHFFLCDRIIALYLGSDEAVITALTELCGPRFSGLN